MRQIVRRLRPKLRRLVAKSWILSRCYYPLRGHHLSGRPTDEIWYFAYGGNMNDSTFRVRRRIRPLEHRSGHIKGYRLRFNLDGRPSGKAAPANLYPDPDSEVWGVLYRITRRDLTRLDCTEGVPGRGYRHVMIEAKDRNGRVIPVITYMAQGKEVDGKPSLRYITLLREAARFHVLPENYICFLEGVEHAQ